jgi:hypothetical protein
MTEIERFLNKKGPLISSELAKLVARKTSIPINTASQRISRSSGIKQIRGFFKSNQSLCYLESHVKDDLLMERLSESMYDYGRKYWFTLNALKMHDGILSSRYLECYTNYPVKELKKHIPFDKVMERFVKEKILIFDEGDYFFSPKFSKTIPKPLLHRTIELIKDNLLADLNSLTKNTGMISYNSGETFAEFGKFRWGFKGVCPIVGLRDGAKFGFLLADILLGKPFYKDDVLFFIEKLNHIQSFKNSSRLLPMLLIDDLNKDAFHYLKQHGVVIGFIKELFGQKYAATLKELITILNNAGASLKSEPDKYLDLIKELKKYNEGLANNIRGTLFEFVVGHIHGSNGSTIELGREVFGESTRVDMDVLAIYRDKVVMAECKATKSMPDTEMIHGWLSETIPALRKWVLSQDQLRNRKLEFQFWSTSGFTNKAEEDLKDAIARTKHYSINYFGPEEIRAEAIAMKNKKLKEALDNYFLKTEV